MLYGAAYYPEHRDPAKWEYDLDLMAKARVNCIRVGEFAWKRFEPQKDKFDFSWLDRFMDLADEGNIRILLCPPARTLPYWLVRDEPDLAIIDEEGDRLGYGSRYTFCINQPLLRERAAHLAEKMAIHYKDRDTVIGWHLDNEQGDEPDCHCPICRRLFQDWCREKFGTIDNLNEKWGLVFWGLELDSFDDVYTPMKTKTNHNPSLLQAWREFRSDSTIGMIKLQGDKIRLHRNEKQYITTNHQPIWNNRTDYYKAAPCLDLAGTNYYPRYGSNLMSSFAMAQARSYNRKNPAFQVHELRNGPHMVPGLAANQPRKEEVAKLAWHVTANGAKGIFFFRWRACPFGSEQIHGTITDFDGRPLRSYEEIKRTGEELERLAPLLEESTVNSQAAVLLDYPTRWTMELPNWLINPSSLYMEQTQKIYNSFAATGLNVDLTGRDSDWSGYKVLAVPFLSVCEDDLAGKFIRFVEKGGTILWHPLCGIKDAQAVIHADRIPRILSEKLGDYPGDYFTLDQEESVGFSWRGKDYKGRLFGDYLSGMDDKTAELRTWNWGSGRFDYLTTLGEEDFYRDYMETQIDLLGLERSLPLSPPEGVEAVTQRTSDGREILFLLNHNYHGVEVETVGKWSDLIDGDVKEGVLHLGSCGVRVMRKG